MSRRHQMCLVRYNGELVSARRGTAVAILDSHIMQNGSNTECVRAITDGMVARGAKAERLAAVLALRAAGFNDAADLLELGKHVEAVRALGATNGAE